MNKQVTRMALSAVTLGLMSMAAVGAANAAGTEKAEVAVKGAIGVKQNGFQAQSLGGETDRIVQLAVSAPSDASEYTMSLTDPRKEKVLVVVATGAMKTLKMTSVGTGAVLGQWAITPTTSPADISKISLQIEQAFGATPASGPTGIAKGTENGRRN